MCQFGAESRPARKHSVQGRCAAGVRPRRVGRDVVTLFLCSLLGTGMAGSLAGCGPEAESTPDLLLAVIRGPLPLANLNLPYAAEIGTVGGRGGVQQWQVLAGALPSGLELEVATPSSGLLHGVPEEAGLFEFLVAATDAVGGTATGRLALTVDEPPPQLEVHPVRRPSDPRVDGLYVSVFEARGGSGNGYVWSVEGGLPPGLRLDPLGPQLTVVGQPTQGGPYAYTVRCRDAAGQQDQITVEGGVLYPPLVLPPMELEPARVGMPYEVELQAEGGGTLPMAWSIGSRAPPPGMRLDLEATGRRLRFFGVPQVEGINRFEVVVTDGEGQQARRTLELAVFDGQPPLFLQTPALPPGAVAVDYQAELRATGGSPPYTWTLLNGRLPLGWGFRSEQEPWAEVFGVAREQGVFELEIQVTDALGARARRSFQAFVGGAPLEIVTDSLPVGRKGRPYRGELETRNAPSAAGLAWYVTQGDLPPGLGLPGTGYPGNSILGTPNQVGEFHFTVAVSSGGDDQSHWRNYSITIVE